MPEVQKAPAVAPKPATKVEPKKTAEELANEAITNEPSLVDLLQHQRQINERAS